LLSVIDKDKMAFWFPTERMPAGEESRRNDDIGITHVHHFYTTRNLSVLAALVAASNRPDTLVAILDANSVTTKMSRFRVPAWVNKTTGPMKGLTSGTLYVPSLPGEQNCFNAVREKTQMVIPVGVPHER
jgi:hypothetical protein